MLELWIHVEDFNVDIVVVFFLFSFWGAVVVIKGGAIVFHKFPDKVRVLVNYYKKNEMLKMEMKYSLNQISGTLSAAFGNCWLNFFKKFIFFVNNAVFCKL